MENICPKNLCTGCFACSNICPKDAITPKADNEGFAHPAIDAEKCIDCGLCEKVCPINHPAERNLPIAVFSGWANDERIRRESSSGGAFSVLAQQTLSEGGIVVGAALDENLKAVHIAISDASEMSKLRGSKYVQSAIGLTYRLIKEKLSEGKKVLFSGTPCYVAGLRNYLQKEYDNLVTVDIICHGVPSPLVFEQWKSWFKKSYSVETIKTIKFRDKKLSWLFFNMDVEGTTKSGDKFSYAGGFFKDAWIRGFLSDRFLRPACHRCQFADHHRCSDITIADWWGYKNEPNEPNDFEKKGVSLILCNTTKGESFFNQASVGQMSIKSRKFEDAIKTNPTLSHPTREPADRAKFWECFHNETFDNVAKRYMRPVGKTPQEWIMSITTPGKQRQLMLNIFYKFRRLYHLLFPSKNPDPTDRLTIYQRVCRRLKWYRNRFFRYHYAKSIKRSISNKKGKTIYLFCPPIHNNLGDQAQTMCIYRWFNSYYPDYNVEWIPMQVSDDKTLALVKEKIADGDLIFVHSGYLTTELYGYLPFIARIVDTFTSNKITILPQTVNIATDEMRDMFTRSINANPNVTFICRDETSYAKAQELFTCRVLLYPDIVTSLIGLEEFNFATNRNGILMVLRDDKEKFYSDEQLAALASNLQNKGVKIERFDTTINCSPFTWTLNRERTIKRYLRKFADYKLIITDRYHGTIFGQIVSTPTIVIASSDHKLASGVRWFPEEFSNQLFFAESLEQAERIAERILQQDSHPTQSAPYFNENYWSKLHNEL